eukprot:SM000265S09783  [mRNA]  locus=s265:58830:63153:- [translate_table: standard]
MADFSLEDELLQVAGRSKRGGGGGPPPPSARKARPLSDSSSEGDDEGDGRDRGQRTKGSRMPLKKRFGDKDDEDGDGGNNDGNDGVDNDSDDSARKGSSDSDLSFGSDLYKSKEDKRKLMAMTELEREMILAERAEQREQLLTTKRLQKAAEKKEAERAREREQELEQEHEERDQEPPPPPVSRGRALARGDTPRTAKESALHELVARRQRSQQETPARGGGRSTRRSGVREDSYSPPDESDSESRSGREEEEEAASSSASRGRRSDGGGRELGAGVQSDDDDDEDDDEGRGEPDVTPEDLLSIVVRRHKLIKWFQEPFFEELIVGCLVRLGIGTSGSGVAVYRVCEVVAVDGKDTSKQYKLESKTTHKWLDCQWGDKRARWQMARVSDTAPKVREIEEWVRELDKAGLRKLTKADVDEKRDALAKVNSYRYTAAAVKQMLEEKRLAASGPRSFALEKGRLLQEKELAEQRGDTEEAAKVQALIEELDAKHRLQLAGRATKSRAATLAEMNKRNRQQNFKLASEAGAAAAMAGGGAFGEANYDPFSRRWTRSQNYYKSPVVKVEAEAGAGATDAAMHAEDPVTAKLAHELGSTASPTAAAAAAAAAAGLDTASAAAVEQPLLANTSAPVDEGVHVMPGHDFDLPIDLSILHKMNAAGGPAAAFMARKRRQEVTCGVQVGSSDSRRHSLVLTVNDYKRRRGLL